MKKLSHIYHQLELEQSEDEEEICLAPTYGEGRRCEICNCFLNIYNSSLICWSHQELFWEEKEEWYAIDSYEDNYLEDWEDSFSLFMRTEGIDETWTSY